MTGSSMRGHTSLTSSSSSAAAPGGYAHDRHPSERYERPPLQHMRSSSRDRHHEQRHLERHERHRGDDRHYDRQHHSHGNQQKIVEYSDVSSEDFSAPEAGEIEDEELHSGSSSYQQQQQRHHQRSSGGHHSQQHHQQRHYNNHRHGGGGGDGNGDSERRRSSRTSSSSNRHDGPTGGGDRLSFAMSPEQVRKVIMGSPISSSVSSGGSGGPPGVRLRSKNDDMLRSPLPLLPVVGIGKCMDQPRVGLLPHPTTALMVPGIGAGAIVSLRDDRGERRDHRSGRSGRCVTSDEENGGSSRHRRSAVVDLIVSDKEGVQDVDDMEDGLVLDDDEDDGSEHRHRSGKRSKKSKKSKKRSRRSVNKKKRRRRSISSVESISDNESLLDDTAPVAADGIAIDIDDGASITNGTPPLLLADHHQRHHHQQLQQSWESTATPLKPSPASPTHSVGTPLPPHSGSHAGVAVGPGTPPLRPVSTVSMYSEDSTSQHRRLTPPTMPGANNASTSASTTAAAAATSAGTLQPLPIHQRNTSSPHTPPLHGPNHHSNSSKSTLDARQTTASSSSSAYHHGHHPRSPPPPSSSHHQQQHYQRRHAGSQSPGKL